MSAPSYASGDVPVVTAIDNSNVSAGNFTGTNAEDSSRTGNANNRSRVVRLTPRAIASTVEDIIRVYRKQGSTYYYLFSIKVPANTVAFPNEPWIGQPIHADIPMASGNTIAYNHQANNGTLYLEEVWREF